MNDTWGGKDFTEEFVPGETVGIGVMFRVPTGGADEASKSPRIVLDLLFNKVRC